MIVRRAWGFLPAFVSIADKPILTKSGHVAGADTQGIFIRMAPENIANEPAIQHELRHARNNMRAWIMPWTRMGELEGEVDAYRYQLTFIPVDARAGSADQFSFYLANRYGFGVTQEQALELLIRKE